MFIKFHQPYSYCYFYFTHILDRTDWLQSIYCQLNEGTADSHHINELLWVIGGWHGPEAAAYATGHDNNMSCINLVL